MQSSHRNDMPESHINYPTLRLLDIKRVQEGDDQYLCISDPLGLNPSEVLVPIHLAPFLSLCDGEHDVSAIRTALDLRIGLSLSSEDAQNIIHELDEALMLEGPRLEEAQSDALKSYHMSPFRTPRLAGKVYPSGPDALEKALDSYCQQFPAPRAISRETADRVVGLLSPHIDFRRGHRVYAETWQSIEEAFPEFEQVFLLGTDHSGSGGRVTLTQQNYATPWGVLPNDPDLVNTLIKGLGKKFALGEELHHVNEHSLELAAVWLHYFLRRAKGRTSYKNMPTVIPILCGSMTPYIYGQENPSQDDNFATLLTTLDDAMKKRRTLIVVAGDLAHVGPAFGDSRTWDEPARTVLRNADYASMAAMCGADAEGFFQGIQEEQDARKICGLTPIYLALRLMGAKVAGERLSYEQCAADSAGTSFVSIAGVMWSR